MDTTQKALRFYFKGLATISPSAAGKASFKLFQKVRKKSIRKREEIFFEKANQFDIQFKNTQINCYELGNEHAELVFLVHGWDSNAGSLSKIAFALVEEGKRVVAFNLPAHAFSKEKSTNLLACGEAFRAVIKHVSPAAKPSIISHSFGSAVVSLALKNGFIAANKLIFLTNPNKVENIYKDFTDYIGLNAKAQQHLIKLTEDVLNAPIASISVEQNLQTVQYEALYLLHDKNDKVLPIENSLEVLAATEKSSLKTFEKTGHYKMLWNDEVVETCVNFLK